MLFFVFAVFLVVAVSQAVSHDCFAGNAANLLHLSLSLSLSHSLSVPATADGYISFHRFCRPLRILRACGDAFDAAAVVAVVVVNVAAINALAGPVSLFFLLFIRLFAHSAQCTAV